MVKKCIICEKEFQGKSNSSRYCSDECRNTPLYTDEINREQYGHLTVTNAFRKKSKLYAVCKCSCGKEFVVLAKNFPRVKFCGCAQTRARKKNIQKAQETFLNGCVENSSVYCIKPKKMQKNNTSGVRDITYDRTSQKWQAQIAFKGKIYKLGRYIDKEDAIRARKMAEEAMFGNFLKWFQDTYPDRWKRMTNTDSSKNEITVSKTMGKGAETESFDSTKK